MVPEEGLEPSNLAVHDFESCVYTSFTTPAILSACTIPSHGHKVNILFSVHGIV